jgi:hypothetical protein
LSINGCQHSLTEFKFLAILTITIDILSLKQVIGMYFACLLVKAEAKAEAIK